VIGKQVLEPRDTGTHRSSAAETMNTCLRHGWVRSTALARAIYQPRDTTGLPYSTSATPNRPWGTLNSQEWKSWHHNAVVEIAGVELLAPNIRAGKRGSRNLGRRKVGKAKR